MITDEMLIILQWADGTEEDQAEVEASLQLSTWVEQQDRAAATQTVEDGLVVKVYTP